MLLIRFHGIATRSALFRDLPPFGSRPLIGDCEIFEKLEVIEVVSCLCAW
jgi:hypothetical protein